MNNFKEEKRTPNFTPSEKDCLFNIIASYAHILEDKKTNRINIEEKNQVWKKIEQKFNTEGPILCYRSSEQLKRLYENKKKDLRKKLAEHKKQTFLTGGGPPPEFKLDPIDDMLIQIVNEKTVKGFDVPFDCDSEPILKKKKENDSDRLEDLEFEFTPNEILSDQDNSFQEEIINKGRKYNQKCPPKYLRTPLSAELEFQPSTSRVTPDNHELSDAKTPTSNKSSKVLQTNRRRPQAGIRTLTSSDVSEKYNILLDRRLVLIEKQIEQATESQNFSREEQKKKMEILEQQKDILSLEKEEKKLKVELLKVEVAYKKSII